MTIDDSEAGVAMGRRFDVAIWKFVLPIVDFVRVRMPEGAEILSVQPGRQDEVCMWALVNPVARLVSRGFVIRGTGQTVGTVGAFIGTVQTHSGQLVWHIFEAA